MPKIKRAVSGGQTGVDSQILVAAKELNIPSGGFAPPGFLTERGPNLFLRDFYGLVEVTPEQQGDHAGKSIYVPRTELNVIHSDGTVYFSVSKERIGGLKQTEQFAIKHNKPFILNPTAEKLRQWIEDNNIETLNVAGNRASKLTQQQILNIRQLLIDALK